MKNKILKVVSYVLVAVVAAGLTYTLTMLGLGQSKLQQLERYLLTYFVDGADAEKLEDAAASGMVSALGDRWSYYVPADQFQSLMDDKNNSYVGIGVTITVKESGFEVLKIVEGGPAEEAGVLVGDILTEADGHSLAGLTSDEARKYIQGKEGTAVQITLLRAGEEMTFRVERRTVRVTVATGAMLEGNIGLVKINNFHANCFADTKTVVEELQAQGATALIFDVRFNGGGYVEEMIKLLDYLLPEGDLFRTVDYKGNTSVDRSDAACLELPMAVIINGDSYSAAEFFAAALHEYEWAILVGEQTSGKGYFQSTFRLNDGSAVAISTGKYFTPEGVSLEGVGLTPEVYVEVDGETAAKISAGILPYAEDPQIIAAINALKSAK